jgi:hypothetical protein
MWGNGKYFVYQIVFRKAKHMEGVNIISLMVRFLRDSLTRTKLEVAIALNVGLGRIIHPNGDYFEGELKDGVANGTGVYAENDITYEGEFKNNLQHGKGK